MVVEEEVAGVVTMWMRSEKLVLLTNGVPDLRKIVVDYQVEIGGGRLTLNVSSAPIPDLGQPEAK